MESTAIRPTPHTEAEPRYRSSAVARMVRMPVATLRVWERRYRVSSPALTPSGQRLYSSADVRRIALLKQLTDRGHAIGNLANLDMAQLQSVAATHASVMTSAQPRPGAEPATAAHAEVKPWRVAVVGAGVAKRLQQPGFAQALDRSFELVGPFDEPRQAAMAMLETPADALLMHAPGLHPQWLDSLHAAAPSLSAVPTAVVYGFATEAVRRQLQAAGVTLLREPLSEAAFDQWLGDLGAPRVPQLRAFSPVTGSGDIPQRRWDDATLADLAGLSTTIGCECPRHLVEILTLLGHFEAYSAECESRSPADAKLHAYLHREAAAARARFEEALARVAEHEGLLLPD